MNTYPIRSSTKFYLESGFHFIMKVDGKSKLLLFEQVYPDYAKLINVMHGYGANQMQPT